MAEARHFERVRTILGAQIIFNNKQSTIDCQIRNLSSAGAKLVLSETVTLPDEFELLVPHRSRTYRAKLRWRTTDAVGVDFQRDEELESMELPADINQRVHALESENAELRKRIRGLIGQLEAATGVSVQTM